MEMENNLIENLMTKLPCHVVFQKLFLCIDPNLKNSVAIFKVSMIRKI